MHHRICNVMLLQVELKPKKNFNFISFIFHPSGHNDTHSYVFSEENNNAITVVCDKKDEKCFPQTVDFHRKKRNHLYVSMNIEHAIFYIISFE